MPRYAYVNGRYLPHAQAAVHIEDRGYQFADGVYEVVPVYRGALVDEGPHLDRLERSLRELRIQAFGTEGVLVEHAPLAIELEAPENVIGLALFAIDGHSIRAIQPGIARLWVTSLIPTRRGDTFSLPVVIIVTGQRTIPQPPFLY